MPTDAESGRPRAGKLLAKVVIYYAVLITGGVLMSEYLPKTALPAVGAFEALFTGAAPAGAPKGTVMETGAPLAVTVAIAMIAAALLSLPVGWVYLMTRARRGFQQSVVQLLIVLPMVISGIVVLVKYSVALAFSLAGIVAAVRFRNTLEDSKDAVYVFLATAIGFAAGIDVPVALAISIVFNATVLLLWKTNFGHAPLDAPEVREIRLRMPTREFRMPTREFKVPQPAPALQTTTAAPSPSITLPDTDRLIRLRVRTREPEHTRRVLESGFDGIAKKWNFDRLVPGNGDGDTLEYMLTLKKKTQPDDVLAFANKAGAMVQAEVV